MSGRVAADTWPPARFWVATSDGLKQVSGYTLAGLGLHRDGAAGGTKTRWTLTHLGSGGAVLRPVGTLAAVMPFATEIARCCDWTQFDTLGGWRQTDPDLFDKVSAILDAHPEVKLWCARAPITATPDEARAVIAAREADDAR